MWWFEEVAEAAQLATAVRATPGIFATLAPPRPPATCGTVRSRLAMLLLDPRSGLGRISAFAGGFESVAPVFEHLRLSC